ncbi:AFI1/MesA family protein [Sporobolomyces salmoneus]|uniref:AFI1/MesA family protein n=1 Tax=Sporobolomyces salmoneus TaxID=183962 RepID=UPI0031756082
MASLPTSQPSISSLHSLAAKSTTSRQSQQLLPPYPIHPQVEYVLLAEFDIDEGSVLRHEYPAPTGTDQHLLAEHMLPDGAHDRTEDWTVFYLNQIKPLTVNPNLLATTPEGLEAAKSNRTSAGGGGGAETFTTTGNAENGGLLYVLSLVRTKKDATVRRGALVKALAVATRNPYIQIYKPILLLALEDYFSTPSVSVLARLYNAINSIDTTSLPFLSLDERSILRTSDRKDMFEEKFGLIAGGGGGSVVGQHEVRRMNSNMSFSTKKSSTDDVEVVGNGRFSSNNQILADDDSSIAEVLSPASTSISNSNMFPPSSGNNSRSRSSGSISSLPSRPPSSAAAHTNTSTEDLTTSTSYGSQSRSRANTITSSEGGDTFSNLQRDFMYSAAANHPLPNSTSSPDAQTMTGGRRSLPPPGPSVGKPKDTHWYETKVAYGGLNLPIRIPLGTFPSEVGDYSLINLIQTFSAPNSLVPSSILHPSLHTSGASTPPIILLFNALVTGHRVVFLGHGQAAGKVADLVLAACALASGCGTVLRGFEGRCFPYTNLSNLDNLENVPGYIAGVCNPAFADRPTWWDVLCNIETGKITVSKDLKPPLAGIQGGIRGMKLDGGDRGGEGASSHKEKEKEKGDKGETADNIFMEEVLHAIQAHYGESVIRARFTEYAARFVRLASRWEEETSSITSIGFPCAPYRDGRLGSGVVFGDELQGKKELQRDAARIEGWMATPSYTLYQQYFRNSLEFAPLREFDLYHQLSRLRQGRQLSPNEVTLIFQTIAQSLKGEREITALLAHLPSHFGGLLPLSFGLFHPSSAVRTHTLDLFDQIGTIPIGKKFLSSLNAFHRSAYNRLSLERLHEQQQQQQQLYEERGEEGYVAGSNPAQQQSNGGGSVAGSAGGRDREATVTMNLWNGSVSSPPIGPPPPLPNKDL